MKPSLKMITVGAGVFCALILGFAGALALYSKFRVPNFASLRGSVEMEIKRADGTEATRQVGPKAPGWVPLELISDYVLMAVISSEDTTFYQHKGIDLHELREAIKKDIKEKRWARGASTLTQQVVKNVFLSQEKTLWRKFREILWAAELEKELSKSEILCFYLNMAEFGPGIYGVGQAATYYFGVVPARLSVREAAFLAMLLPAPRKYHAYFRTKNLTPWAKKRLNHILRLMHRLGYLDEATYQGGLAESLWGVEGVPQLAGDGAESDAPLPVEEEGESLEEPPGEPSDEVVFPPVTEAEPEPESTPPAEPEPTPEEEPPGDGV